MSLHLKRIVATVAIGLLPLSVAAAESGGMRQLDDGVYMFSENHYVSIIVIGDDGVLITDPAYPARAESMKKAIAEVTDNAVDRIVLTHEHYDHVGGTEVFPGAQVFCHRSCQAVFDLDVFGITPRKVDVEFGDFLRIDAGGATVELYHYGPADGFASTVVFLPAERIAYSADLYENESLTDGMWMDDANYLAIRRVLRELLNMDLKHAVNSHSDDTSVRAVEENLAFVEDLYQLVFGQIMSAMQAGGPVAVITSLEKWQNELKLPQYADWAGYDEHLPVHVRRMAMSIFHGG